ncbi:phosphopantetheine-binding protein [Marmoricola sp. RAF53]|uniref:phosphopantetheine-binding protein n=1 Tax=Marmoricola sp. RAF53 TaxID=3233059 RepID=UPI003F9641AF
MSDKRSEVNEAIRAFLGRANKLTEFDDATPLFADGLALDSLETAELSAVLEDEFGSDPFSAGEFAETVGQIFAYYDQLAS